MLAKLATTVPRDGLRTAVIGANRIVKLAITKWPCHGTVQRAMAQPTNHLYTKHTPLLLANSQVFTL